MLNAHIPRKRKRDGDQGGVTLGDIIYRRGRDVLPVHLLFECATGYALIHARGIHEVEMLSLQSVDKYLNQSQQPFKLEAYLPFSSDEDALIQMKAISNSLMTEQLQKFLEDSLPQPNTRGSHHSIATVDSYLGDMIINNTGMAFINGVPIRDIMRGLRMKIHQLIGLTRRELESAQLNLACLHINQMRTKTFTKSRILASSSSSLQQEVVRVVPHRFDGVFNIEGEENMLCTINLVPGEALYGEQLVCGQTLEDRTEVEVEYRVWNPLRSKLGAAILAGVTNIWIKPGSRVLYIGNVCGLTISDLSDLVGSDGLVYAVGFHDDVVDMAGKRPNVVTIIEQRGSHLSYRMLLGVVDIMFVEIDRRPDQHAVHPLYIVNNARFYLRAGGRYLVFTRANDMDSIGEVKDPLAEQYGKEKFKATETVVLDLKEGAYALAVGGYQLPHA